MANTVVTIMACAIGFGGYISGIFGMNLDNTEFIQPKAGSFLAVAFSSFAFIVLSVVITIAYLRFTGVLPTHVKYIPDMPQLPQLQSPSWWNCFRKKDNLGRVYAADSSPMSP